MLGEDNEFVITFSGIECITFFIDHRGHNNLHRVCVGPYRRRSQPTLHHHCAKILQRKIADGVERHMPDVRIEPVLQAAFPICKRRRSHWLALTVLHFLQPNLGLFAKRNTVVRTNDFFKILPSIRPAGLDYFLALSFPFGCREAAGTGNRADSLSYSLPLFLARDILPEPNDIPLAILLNGTILTRSTRHGFSPCALFWRRLDDCINGVA